ncbi:hypothetical protein [Defluviimonas salinarum]|uniref:Transposase n=1 Tax=Defluviimonas salinarum TaxID=2992147 RepID=A0ABT3J8Y3_9RHOB|nr:hypothetical protein [Defluviimonas salinarum]MCW3784145.1 hypothetical protein [Defluviimonas salinarum]
MAGYVSPPAPHPLGQHREEIEELRKQKGLDEKGFPVRRKSGESSDDGGRG